MGFWVVVFRFCMLEFAEFYVGEDLACRVVTVSVLVLVTVYAAL